MRSRSRWVGSGFRLAPVERGRALRALLWLVASELAVRVVPYSTLTRWAERVPPSRRATLTPGECATDVRRAARAFPAGRCLARALAASCLLRRAGRIATVRLGVGFDANRRFEAHAWLECEGIVVTGGEESEHYVALTPTARQHS